MNGSVTSIGLAINPAAKHGNDNNRCFCRFDSTYRAQAPRDSNAKNVLSTSLRSAIQATDSRCNGCHANSAADPEFETLPAVINRPAEVRSLLRPKTTRCERSAKKIVRRRRWSRIYSYG